MPRSTRTTGIEPDQQKGTRVSQGKRLLSAAGLLLVAALTLVLTAPAALAGVVDSAGPAVTPTGPEPMALASTGLNITVPVIIGLTLLILGIAVVAWAFLRTGSTDQRH